eukprot:jgi/Chlat1/8019/Chrsp7S07782
MCPTMLPTTSR